MQRFFLLQLLIISTTLSLFAGEVAETIRSIADRPLYLQPLATILGTATNSGWYQSATVGKNFGFGVALPISLVYLSNNDRKYSGTYTDEACVECRGAQQSDPTVNCLKCIECKDFTAPTIIGSVPAPLLFRSQTDLHHNILPDSIAVDPPFSDGIDELRGLGLVPFTTLQTSFSYYYANVTLRYLFIPTIGGFACSFPGIGVQYDVGHFFPELPVSLSLAANCTFLSIAWTPDEAQTDGTVHLDGLSNFIGCLAGYRLGRLELFLETGWEHSYLSSSGTLTVDGERIVLESDIPGRNGFRAGLSIALPIGYHPVLGVTGGAQFGNSINLISYKRKEQ